MSEGEKFVTVEVSTELLAQLQDGWTPPVHVRIGPIADGYTMTAKTHMCEPCTCPHISDVDDYCPQHGRDS
jgi:hypothetical protein